jgi:YidC/Oxa1 family membrane protein insertase
VGLLNPLYDAVSWVLLRFHSLFSLVFPADSGAAWGLSIVGLVVLIRIALIPLFVKQIKAQRGLQMLQPQMKAIQEKHKNDKQKQSEELMKLYKDTGTNPLSSCLPILVQSPFFFSLFHVLSYISRGLTVGVMGPVAVASFGSATIFGAPIYETFTKGDTNTKIVAGVLIMPAGQSNPMMQQQKILLYVFPAMFAVFGINFPIGVLIYWFTTNLWTMGQQLIVIRRNPTPGSAAYDDLQRRKAEKAAARGTTTALAPGDAGATTATATEQPAEGATDDPAAPKRQQPRRTSRSKRTRPPKKPS